MFDNVADTMYQTVNLRNFFMVLELNVFILFKVTIGATRLDDISWENNQSVQTLNFRVLL